jgi:hypothetical protein
LQAVAEVKLKLHLNLYHGKEKAALEAAEVNLAIYHVDNLHLLLKTLKVGYQSVMTELAEEHGALEIRVLQEL